MERLNHDNIKVTASEDGDIFIQFGENGMTIEESRTNYIPYSDRPKLVSKINVDGNVVVSCTSGKLLAANHPLWKFWKWRFVTNKSPLTMVVTSTPLYVISFGGVNVQVEEGNFATSYISVPDTTPVTRCADVCYIDFDDIFDQT